MAMKYDFSACGHAKSRPDSFQRAKAALVLGMRPGFPAELDDYLDRYGYLSLGGVELLGMTGHQGLSSDMVRVTEDLQSFVPWMAGRAAFLKITDDRFAACGMDGLVYVGTARMSVPEATGLGFYDYIYGVLMGDSCRA